MQLRPTGWRTWRRPGLQTQVREDLLNHWPLQHRRDVLQLAAAVRAVFQLDLEHPLEQLGPAQPNRTVVRAGRLALGRGRRCDLRGWFGLLGFLRHHLCSQLGVGCKYAVVRAAGVRSLREAKLREHQTNQVQPRSGHQRSQPLHELQRRHHEVRGAVTPSGLELEHDLPSRVGLHALVGQSRPRDVTASLLQPLAASLLRTARRRAG